MLSQDSSVGTLKLLSQDQVLGQLIHSTNTKCRDTYFTIPGLSVLVNLIYFFRFISVKYNKQTKS